MNISFILGYTPRSEIACSYGQIYVKFYKELQNCFPEWLYQFAFLPVVYKSSRYFAFSPLLGIVSFIDLSNSNRWLMGLIFFSLMATAVKHLFMSLLLSTHPILWSVCWRLSPIFKLSSFFVHGYPIVSNNLLKRTYFFPLNSLCTFVKNQFIIFGYRPYFWILFYFTHLYIYSFYLLYALLLVPL